MRPRRGRPRPFRAPPACARRRGFSPLRPRGHSLPCPLVTGDSVDWRMMSMQLTRYAFVALKRESWDLARQIAQDAVAHHLDPAYPRWDPDQQDLFGRLSGIARGLVANHWRKRSNRYERAWPDEDLASVAPLVAPP